MKTEYFHDDKLGRVLDKLYSRGLNKIFISVVLEAVKIYQLETSTVHLDSTQKVNKTFKTLTYSLFPFPYKQWDSIITTYY